MATDPLALHPIGVPHAEGGPFPLASLAIIVALVAAVGWVVRDVARDRRRAQPDAPAPHPLRSPELGSPPADAQRPPARREALVLPIAPRAKRNRPSPLHRWSLGVERALARTEPLSVAVALAGLLAGLYAYPEARLLTTAAWFVGSDDMLLLERLGWAFAILLFVGAALAVPAPGAAAVAFAASVTTALVLALVQVGPWLTLYERWRRLPIWLGVAVVLTLAALAARRRAAHR